MPSPETRTRETFQDWENRMRYHPAQPGQREIYEENRRRYLELARYVFDTLPGSPERTLALRRLNDSLMLANQTVAIHDVGVDSPQ